MTAPPSQPDRSRASQARRAAEDARVDASAKNLWFIIIPALVPLLALLILYAGDVPLGQPGYLVYRYSAWVVERVVRSIPALVIGAVGLAWMWRAGALPVAPSASDRASAKSSRGSRWWCAGAACAWVALCAWTFCAPPGFIRQQVFNLNSPSHDGAFVIEAMTVQDVHQYLARGFQQRLARAPEEMRGTRVLSNPPGATLLAAGVARLLEASAAFAGWMQGLMNWSEGSSVRHWPRDFEIALGFGMLLTLMWGAALPIAYALARLYLRPWPAAAVAFACVCTPATLNFTPGKDPAQLLTVLLMLYTGMDAHLQRRALTACAFGVCCVIGVALGLVHAWIAALLAVSTLWHAWRVRRDVRAWMWRSALPALAGLAVGAGLLGFGGLNVFSTAVDVARRYPDLQRYLINGWYTFVGFPVFLLFAGPMLWILGTAVIRRRVGRAGTACQSPPASDEARRLGAILSASTLLGMTYCYFFANNNESARLWIPFAATLTVSLSMTVRDMWDGARADRRLAALLVALQLGGSVGSWSLMDMRESEWRLSTGRFWS